jgi:hypothetical protein
MRFSVLLTVLKLRFSRVRKYFWLREMVDSCAESLRIDSSRTVVCSGEEPCLEGMAARGASFSTCVLLVACTTQRLFGLYGFSQGTSYGNLKVHKLLGERAHLVVEAEAVLAHLVGREDEIALALLHPVEDDLLRPAIGPGAHHGVINVERAAGLDGEVERDLGALDIYVGEEARLLVCIEAVGEGGGVHGGAVRQQEADNRGKGPHRDRGRRTASLGLLSLLLQSG